MLLIVEHGGIQDHLIDVALEGILATALGDYPSFGVVLGATAQARRARRRDPCRRLSGGCFSGCTGEAGACPEAAVACAKAGLGKPQSRKIVRINRQLLQGCIVSGTGVNGKLGQSFGRNQLYLQFTPLCRPVWHLLTCTQARIGCVTRH